MIAFINEHRDTYGVEPICRVLPIAPSTYYAHAARRADPDKRPARARRDDTLQVEIRRVFEENRSTACAKSGGSSPERGSRSPAAPWRA